MYKEKNRPDGWENLYVGLESELGQDTAHSKLHVESEISGEEQLFNTGQEPTVTTLQLGRKYIVGTIKSGLLVIHQHRAHQRVLYERFLKNLARKETVSQQLLFPLVLSYTKPEMRMLKEMQEGLTTLGFSFEGWTDDQLTVKGIPPMLKEDEVGIVLDQLIEAHQTNTCNHEYSSSQLLARTLSKNLAVKTGEMLDSSSQMALVNDLFACGEADRSPFNKPIFVTLSQKDVENKFN